MLKPGEKVLFTVFGAFFVLAVIGYVALEIVRSHMNEPMFVSRSSYDFSSEGRHGSQLFRESGCTACHRAMRNGTNHGISLDGIGSRRSRDWLERFLKDPHSVYATATIDHGLVPKEAAWVSTLPATDLRDIAVFLSELKAEQGSATARLPPEETSGFVKGVANFWAPEQWKQDVEARRKNNAEADAQLRQGAQGE